MTARIAAILRCLYASTKLGFCLLFLVPGFALADGTPAIANSPISIQSVTLTERSKPGQSAVLPLPVRSYRDQRELSAFRASAEFNLPTVPAAPRWVLYTQDLRDGGALSINDVEVGTVPTATQHHTVRHLQPFMFDIPAGVLQAGRNTLVREWSVKENHVFVPRMMLGAKEDIEPLYAQRYFWQYTMAQVSFVFAAIISLILLGLYSQNRSAHQYLWGGASALGWGILNLAYFLTPIPTVLFAYWQLVIHCGLWAFSAGGNFYLLHECGVNHRWYRQISVAWGLAFVVGYIVNFWTTGQTFWPNYTLIWHAGIAAFGLYPVTRLVIATWQQRKLRHLFIC